MNQAFCDLLGYPESELLGKTIWDISHPEDIAKNQRLYERLKHGEPYQLEKRLIRRNGATLWVTVGTSPAPGCGWKYVGCILHCCGYHPPQTRRKSLLDSARRTLYRGTLSDTIRSLTEPSQIQTEVVHTLGAYLKASRVSYLEIAANGNLVSRARYLDGVTEVIGLLNVHQYLPDDMLAKLEAGRAITVTDVKTVLGYDLELQASLEANAIRSLVMLPVLRNEQLVAALCVEQSSAREWKNEEIRLMEETLERMQSAIERIAAEMELRESEERLRLASHAAHLCTWEMDIPDQTYKLGDNFEEVVGFSRDYLPKKSNEVTDRINVPEDLQAVREILIEAVQAHKDEVSSLQYRLIHPENEEIIWVEVNAKLVYDNEDKPQRMFGMLQNITSRRAAEQEKNQLLEREQAQRLAAEQSKLEAEQARTTAEQELTERKLAEEALGAWTDNPLAQEVRSPWLRYGMAIVATAICGSSPFTAESCGRRFCTIHYSFWGGRVQRLVRRHRASPGLRHPWLCGDFVAHPGLGAFHRPNGRQLDRTGNRPIQQRDHHCARRCHAARSAACPSERTSCGAEKA